MNLVGRTPRHQEAGQERFMSFIDYYRVLTKVGVGLAEVKKLSKHVFCRITWVLLEQRAYVLR